MNDEYDFFIKECTIAASPSIAWVSIGQPFDVIRTRLQATSAMRFSGPVNCLKATIKHEGIMALYKGFLPQLLISMPYSTIMFGTYARLKPLKTDVLDSQYFFNVFLAGVGSGVLLTFFQNPLDVWRTRLQTAGTGVSGKAPEITGRPRKTSAAFRGFSMTAVRNLPGNGIFFLTNEVLRESVQQQKALTNYFHPTVLELLIGGFTGVIFNLILTPIEVLRSRMMATTEGGALFHSRRVLSELGPFGFFRGAGVTAAKAFPVNAGGFALLYYTKGKLSVDEDVTS